MSRTTHAVNRSHMFLAGNDISQAGTAAEALKLAGLDWSVEKRNISMPVKGVLTDIPSHKAIVRADTDGVLGVLGKDFTTIQNAKVMEFLEPFVKAGLATYDTAGSFRDGRNVWATAALNKAPIEVGKGDQVNKYLCLLNGHDGSMALRVQFLPVRLVCTNQLAAVRVKHANIRIMHSKKIEENLVAVQEIVNVANAAFEATAEQYRQLARKDVSQKDIKKFVKHVFRPVGETAEREQLALDNMTATIVRLFEGGKGQELQGAKGTYWGLYNAVTEYLTHEKGRTVESRLASTWYGDSANLSARAFEECVRVAA